MRRAGGNGGRWTAAARLWLAWLFCLAAARSETLTVATYNLENYLATDRLAEGAYRRDFPKPEAAKEALRTVLRSLDADVLAVQEIGGGPYLKELQRDLRREGLDYPHVAWVEADDPERRVAVLSRRPFLRVTRHADVSLRYFGSTVPVKRGLLEVAVAAGDGEITLFVLHLKSRFTDRSDDPLSGVRRSAEAEALRDRILERCPAPAETPFLIVGDFNDAPTSRPLRAIQQRGKTRIGHALAALDSRGETWTHRFRKDDSYSRVDYVIVSPALRPAVVGDRARVCDLPETAEASDHRPVVVRLEFARR